MPVTPTEFGLQGFAFPAPEAAACDYPAMGDVQLGVTYGSGVYTGTLVLPATSQVLLGVGFGAGGTEFTGTLAAGGGSQPSGGRSPADIVRWLFIQMGYAADPPLTPWPAFATNEPSRPDNVVTVFDTEGVSLGRSQIDGELFTNYGIQVRVRSVDHNTGWAKADELRTAMAEAVYDEVVTTGGDDYVVHAFSRISNVLPLGTEQGSRRELFTINAVVGIRPVGDL